MEHDAGIDVSSECWSVRMVDWGGKIVIEAKVASEPEALVPWLRAEPFGLARIGLEANPHFSSRRRDLGLAVRFVARTESVRTPTSVICSATTSVTGVGSLGGRWLPA